MVCNFTCFQFRFKHLIQHIVGDTNISNDSNFDEIVSVCFLLNNNYHVIIHEIIFLFSLIPGFPEIIYSLNYLSFAYSYTFMFKINIVCVVLTAENKSGAI